MTVGLQSDGISTYVEGDLVALLSGDFILKYVGIINGLPSVDGASNNLLSISESGSAGEYIGIALDPSSTDKLKIISKGKTPGNGTTTINYLQMYTLELRYDYSSNTASIYIDNVFEYSVNPTNGNVWLPTLIKYRLFSGTSIDSFGNATVLDGTEIIDLETPSNTIELNPSSSNGTGSVLPDDSSNANNGTLYNFSNSNWITFGIVVDNQSLSDKLNILFPISVNESSIIVTPAAVATLPEANIFNSRRDKFMRVIATSATLKFNANELDIMSGFGMGFHNLENGSTVQIRLYDDFNQAGTITYDSTALPAGLDAITTQFQLGDLLPQTFFHSFNEVNWKSAQIDIVAASNTEIDIGRIMPGYVFEPNWNYEWGSKWQWIDNGDANTVSERYRVFNYVLNELQNEENDRYEYEKMKAGKQGDFIVCSQPSATGLELLKNTAVCKRTNDILRTRNRANTNKHSDTFQEVF